VQEVIDAIRNVVEKLQSELDDMEIEVEEQGGQETFYTTLGRDFQEFLCGTCKGCSENEFFDDSVQSCVLEQFDDLKKVLSQVKAVRELESDPEAPFWGAL
jgi:hypothetical protein